LMSVTCSLSYTAVQICCSLDGNSVDSRLKHVELTST